MNRTGASSASGLAVVTGMGAITSVGRTVTTSCAAIRAKISRPRVIPHMEVLASDTQELIPLTGHPIEGVTDGFLGPARWLRLAESAINDLLRMPGLSGPETQSFWAKTGLVAVVPNPDDELFEVEGRDGLEGFRLDFVLPLREELDLPIDERLVWMVGQGQAGAATAVQLGLHELERARLDRVLVVAADSQLDPTALQILAEDNRLKTSEAPLGLQPGEAGACLLLERQTSAQQRGARALALLSGVATGRETENLFSGKPNPGIALADCIREVLDRTCPSSAFPGDVYIDLNGEQWRALQWAMAQVRLNPRLGEPDVHLPCVSLGDIGAASGALGACVAIHDLVRGHVRAGQALVLSSSHGGEVGCLSFHSAGG